MKKITKKWWVWLISILVLASIIGIKIVKSKTNEDINTRNITKLTYPKLKCFLEEQGYLFKTTTITGESINYTYFYNEKMSITAIITTEDYKYVIDYCDKTLNNNASCHITDTSANTSKEMQQQYDSYLKWKDNIGLTQEQIKEVLLKYYLENK